MILNTAAPAQGPHRSLYPLHTWSWGRGTLLVLGTDDILAKRIEGVLGTAQEGLNAALVRDVHLQVHGSYALLHFHGDQVAVATDPYGIIKLYWLRKDARSVLVDDISTLRDERFELDREAIKFFFVCSYTPSKHTFFKEVAKLEPCTLYRFEGGRLLDASLYARLSASRLSGKDFLDRFYECMTAAVDDTCRHYDDACLFLSGGIDSSFLYRLIRARGQTDRLRLLVGRTEGLHQTRKVDNDYDVTHAERLAREDGKPLAVVSYDVSAPSVLDDFHWLRERLFTEYAPAFAYVGWARGVSPQCLILNGQNADSILSFGSMGFPRCQDWSVTGLGGFFRRYFYFFGPGLRPIPTSAMAHLIRYVYYRRHASGRKVDFSRQRHLLGIGLHPENMVFDPEDTAFSILDRPAAMADWFQEAYLDPLDRDHGDLGHHAQSVLLYNKTYMQGSANRTTGLSSLLQGRRILLPYTSLRLLELMTCLKPDWHYAYYGKFPNIEVGRRRLGLPGYIIRRNDPPDSDSSDLIYRRLSENPPFATYLRETLGKADLGRYEGILNASTLACLETMRKAGSIKASALLLRLVWIESILAQYSVR